jgi:hypothetical protein
MATGLRIAGVICLCYLFVFFFVMCCAMWEDTAYVPTPVPTGEIESTMIDYRIEFDPGNGASYYLQYRDVSGVFHYTTVRGITDDTVLIVYGRDLLFQLTKDTMMGPIFLEVYKNDAFDVRYSTSGYWGQLQYND